MRGLFGFGALTLAVFSTAAAADVKAGVDAWSRGEYAKAVVEWRSLADAGDPDAQFNMGQAYKLGRGVPVDAVVAQGWYRKAAAQGHTQAEDNLGLALFQDGKKAEAIPYLERSAKRDEKRAQLVLGTMLFNGDAVPKDWTRAYALMTRSSQQGLTQGSQTLAQMDQYVPAEQRQQGIVLARQYESAARATAMTSPRPTAATGTMRAADVAPSQTGRTPPARPVATPPAPARPRPVAAAPAPTRGGWRIQLGAFRDDGNARALWSRIAGRMGSAQPSYTKVGAVTRLQAGGYASKADATRACGVAKAGGAACVVVAP